MNNDEGDLAMLKLFARMQAQEILLTHLCSHLYLTSKDPVQVAAQHRKDIRDDLGKMTFVEGLDPATSALFSAETANAAHLILEEAAKVVEKVAQSVRTAQPGEGIH